MLVLVPMPMKGDGHGGSFRRPLDKGRYRLRPRIV
jgi:hypothetical protein